MPATARDRWAVYSCVLKPNGVIAMNNQTRIEAINETANNAFQMVTIALVGLFSLAQTVQFIASAMA